MIDIGFDFSGRRVVVTGGVRGTGLHVAQAFLAAGASVSVTGTKILPSLYDADLAEFTYHQLQLASSEAIDSFVERVGEVDVLINAAGARLPGALDAPEREFLTHSALLGFIGPRRLSQQLRARLCSSSSGIGGAVVNVSPTLAWFELAAPSPEGPTHLRSHTEQVGRSWARLGTRVNTVLADTSVRIPSQHGTLRPPARPEAGTVLTRAPRNTAADEATSSLALFLASSGAASVTGQTFTVR